MEDYSKYALSETEAHAMALALITEQIRNNAQPMHLENAGVAKNLGNAIALAYFTLKEALHTGKPGVPRSQP